MHTKTQNAIGSIFYINFEWHQKLAYMIHLRVVEEIFLLFRDRCVNTRNVCQKLSVRKLTYGINVPYKNCILWIVAIRVEKRTYIFLDKLFLPQYHFHIFNIYCFNALMCARMHEFRNLSSFCNLVDAKTKTKHFYAK